MGGKCFDATNQVMKYANTTLVCKAKLIQTYRDLVLLATGSRRKVTIKYFANEVPPRLGNLDVSRSMEQQGVPNEDILRLISERSSTPVCDRADSFVRQQLAKQGDYYPQLVDGSTVRVGEGSLAFGAGAVPRARPLLVSHSLEQAGFRSRTDYAH